MRKLRKLFSELKNNAIVIAAIGIGLSPLAIPKPTNIPTTKQLEYHQRRVEELSRGTQVKGVVIEDKYTKSVPIGFFTEGYLPGFSGGYFSANSKFTLIELVRLKDECGDMHNFLFYGNSFLDVGEKIEASVYTKSDLDKIEQYVNERKTYREKYKLYLEGYFPDLTENDITNGLAEKVRQEVPDMTKYDGIMIDYQTER